ncbi:hypothetical protein CBL_20695 [Carabus blaptoides fortunei]
MECPDNVPHVKRGKVNSKGQQARILQGQEIVKYPTLIMTTHRRASGDVTTAPVPSSESSRHTRIVGQRSLHNSVRVHLAIRLKFAYQQLKSFCSHCPTVNGVEICFITLYIIYLRGEKTQNKTYAIVLFANEADT